MSERYRTGDPYPPWDYPRDGVCWYAWQEPGYRPQDPLGYQINLWLEKMEADAAMNSRRAHVALYATVVILVAAPLAYVMGWL